MYDIAKPFARINPKKRILNFNLAVHDLLGNPPFFEFMFNAEKKILVIIPRFKKSDVLLEIPEYVLKSRGQEISSVGVYKYLITRGLKIDGVYKISGEFYSRQKLMAFDFTGLIHNEREAAIYD